MDIKINKDEFIKVLSDFLNKRDLYLCEYRCIDIGEGEQLDNLLFYEMVENIEAYFKEV